MEICVPCITSKWRVTVVWTVTQIALTVALAAVAGMFFKWSLTEILLIGFVISLSSTSVVIKILQNNREINTRLGQNVIGVLIVQDIVVVAMIILLNVMGGKSPEISPIALNLIGGATLVAIAVYALKKEDFKLPLHAIMRKNHDLQVFAAFLICFGMAVFAELFGLSAALGAFIAGITVAASKDTLWVSKSLHPFYIVFTAIFFLYIGTLINISLIVSHALVVTLLVAGIFVINTAINLAAFKILGQDLKESLYAGALLSQIGEFSFVLGAVGLANHIVTPTLYELIILVISMTMLLSPFWIWVIRKWTGVNCRANTCTFK